MNEVWWVWNMIFFIDELYMLVGVGGVEGVIDVVNVFKLVLVWGEI